MSRSIPRILTAGALAWLACPLGAAAQEQADQVDPATPGSRPAATADDLAGPGPGANHLPPAAPITPPRDLPALDRDIPILEPVALPTGEAKSGVTPQALSLPGGGGSVEGLGESFSPLLSSGTATFGVPIALPPGRRGTQPSLALSYSSSAGNGPVGIGWSLAVPFIARQTDRGLPRYDGTDRFIYNGGQELVEVEPAADADGNPDNGLQAETLPAFVDGFRYFRARVEGGYLRFFLAPDESYWVAEDTDGTFFYLGESAESRVEHADWGIFSWSLTRVVDARGNEVRYLYRDKDDARQAYLTEIVWNSPVVVEGGQVAPVLGAAAEEFQHAVVLSYDERDDTLDSYVSRFRVTTELRLAGVEVSTYLSREDARRTLDRRYELSYEAGSFLSLLSSIRVVGRDGTALPPLTMAYSEVEPHAGPGGELNADLPGWGGFDGRVTEFEGSPRHSLGEARTDLFDLDADAFPDVLVTDPARYDDGHGVFFLDFVEGVGTYEPAQVVTVPRSIGGDLSLSNTNVHPMDLDADGRVELLHMPHVRDWSAYSAEGSRQDGYEWVERGPYDPAPSDLDLTRDAGEIRLLDVDGDHKVDAIRTSGSRTEYFHNAGEGVFEEPVTSCVLHRGMPLRFSNGDLFVADMNGDGIQDLVHLRRGDVGYFPGRGPGLWGGDADRPEDCPESEFGPDREVVMDQAAAGPFWSDLEDDRIRLSDVNGDGLSDLVQVRFAGVDLWINEGGHGFSERYIIERSPFDPGFTQRVRLTDVNASGSRDVLWGDGDRYRLMDLTGGIRPRLLVRVDNGLGKTTELTYEPHTAQQSRAADAGEPWTSVAPFPVQVVSRMTVRDNLGGEYVTEYEYRDALYDGVEAEFRGFREAVVRTVGDDNSPTSEERTVFWQGERPEGGDPDDNPYEALKGAVRLTETCDLSGRCAETTHTTWTVRRLYAGANGDPRSVWQAFASQSDSFRYDTAPWGVSAETSVLPAVRGDAPERDDEVAVRGERSAHLRSESLVDAAGNERRTAALGVLDDPADDVVAHTTHANLSDWLWRPDESFIEPALRRTRRVHNAFGELTDQFVRLEEEDRELHDVHNEYAATGQVVDVQEGGVGPEALRHRALGYDADYAAYLVEEETFTSEAAPLLTTATWDAGFAVVTELRDFNDQPTAIEYDGLSRVAAVYRPGCAEAAVRYEYLLAGDTGTAVNEVVTRTNETCDGGEPEDAASSLESHAYVDGLGRARMTLAEADPLRGDAGAWVRSGVVAFDGKGAASRAYLPDFADAPDFDLRAPRDGYTSTRYDALGRAVRSVAPDRLAATETHYHALSQDVWDPNDLDPESGHYGTFTTTTQDGQGRQGATNERNLVDGTLEEYVTSFSYDPLGDLLTIDRTFGPTNVHRALAYDSLGRRTTNADPDSGLWTYEYSDTDDLLATTDSRGIRVAYGYDLAGRLVTEDHEDDGNVEVAYTFDELRGGGEPADFGLGRLTTVVDESGTTELFYDERGREVRMARTLDFEDVRREEETSYDELGRETSMTYPDGSVASYTYSDRGLLYSASLDDLEAARRIEYNAAGQRLLEELGDAESTRNEYVFDRRQRLSRLSSVTAGGRYFQDNQYEYDLASNIVWIRDLRTAAETDGWSPSPVDRHYGYDALYRLTTVDSTYAVSEPTRPKSQAFAYDFLGNMTSWTDDQDAFYDRSLGAIENGVDTNPAVRPRALVAAVLDANNHLEATYTDAGDLESLSVTKAGTTTVTDLVWDPVHRLSSATVGAVTTDFVYDHADQRRVKDGPAGTVLYVSDAFEVRDTEATKWLTIGSERLLRVTTENSAREVSFYLQDHLGTSAIVLDAADSEPRVSSTSLPYGATEAEVVSDAGFEAEYEFTGKERDEETGLDYFGARYYAANLGRWASPDPLVVHGPSPENPYSYVSGNPLARVDPDGLEDVQITPVAAPSGQQSFTAEYHAGISTWVQKTLPVFTTLPNLNQVQQDVRTDVTLRAQAGASNLQAIAGASLAAVGRGLEGVAENVVALARQTPLQRVDRALGASVQAGARALTTMSGTDAAGFTITAMGATGQAVGIIGVVAAGGGAGAGGGGGGGGGGGRGGGLETRGYRPRPGERTAEGYIQAQVERAGGELTAIRPSGREVVRVGPAGRHGIQGPHAHPMERHVAPSGQVYPREGRARAVTLRDAAELYRSLDTGTARTKGRR
jgi:RHS repeat-associated protein